MHSFLNYRWFAIASQEDRKPVAEFKSNDLVQTACFSCLPLLNFIHRAFVIQIYFWGLQYINLGNYCSLVDYFTDETIGIDFVSDFKFFASFWHDDSGFFVDGPCCHLERRLLHRSFFLKTWTKFNSAHRYPKKNQRNLNLKGLKLAQENLVRFSSPTDCGQNLRGKYQQFGLNLFFKTLRSHNSVYKYEIREILMLSGQNCLGKQKILFLLQ